MGCEEAMRGACEDFVGEPIQNILVTIASGLVVWSKEGLATWLMELRRWTSCYNAQKEEISELSCKKVRGLRKGA